jgi:hypothetical protein
MTNRIDDNLVHFGQNEELVRALVSAKVSFVIIGGLAVSWYCPERQADDLDLLVEPSLENSKRISSALAEIHLVGFLADSFARPGLQVQLKNHHYAEILTPTKDMPTYAEVEAGAGPVKLFGMPALVASIPDLIAMKKVAVSAAEKQLQKHLSDIALLETCVNRG